MKHRHWLDRGLVRREDARQGGKCDEGIRICCGINRENPAFRA